MIPNLPRPFLWTEVRTMGEFINNGITNSALSSIINNMPQELFPNKSIEVKLFNEMYYQMTRFYYEEPKIEEYMEYQKGIIKDMGSWIQENLR